jgi:hypothetical protein
LGLGGGLEVNLDNIDFNNSVSEIHITIKNNNKQDSEKVINFLTEKFKILPSEIKIYKSCDDLIDNCFN